MKKNTGNLLKIPTKDLRVGMYVSDLGRGWLRHPWKTKSKTISGREEITQLLQHGITEVVIDLTRGQGPEVTPREVGLSEGAFQRGQAVSAEEISETLEAREVAPEPKSLEEVERRRKPRAEKPSDDIGLDREIQNAHKAYAKAIYYSRKLIKDLSLGKPIEMATAMETVDEMIDSVFRNRDALVAILKLKNYDEYTFTHSVNVAALTLSIGRQLNYNRDQLMKLGLGALFHDVGKTRVPDAILNKPDRLTNDEFEIMKTHAALGSGVLTGQPYKFPMSVINIVRHHHERMDGSGYPDGLKDREMDPFVILTGMADVYDALTSDRVYRKGMMPHKALKTIFGARDRHFPAAWVDRFVHSLGIYPAGAIVKLNTKEVGIVMAVNHSNLSRPVVRILLTPSGRRMKMVKHVDLNDINSGGYSVVGVMEAGELGIDPATYFGIV